ncbi:MAG: Hsp20/alpha crystallin family protein [Actinomycetota bacterium]
MDIVRWDPFGELDSIHDELNRLFRRSFGAIEPTRRTVANGWMPALDLFETDDKVVAKMDLPGIDPKDVEVSVEDASLTVTGSRRFEQETDEQGYHRVERRFGSFTRSIALPASADADRVEATFSRGVLTIEIAKTEKARARKVAVKDVA